MEVYTNPPPKKYILHKPFTFAINGKGIPAIAYSKDHRPFILAIYAIIIQFFFAFLWQLIAGYIVGSISAKGRIRFVGLVAFWNSPDPWTATFSMISYVLGIYKSRRRTAPPARFQRDVGRSDTHIQPFVRPTARDIRTGIGLLVLSSSVAALSLSLSIAYPGWLEIQDYSVAPVQPHEVAVPLLDIQSHNDAMKLDGMSRQSVMRSLGRAEISEYASERNSYFFEHFRQSEDQSEGFIYKYSVDATDFGLQTQLNLKQDVEGYCVTDYSWFQSDSSTKDKAVYYLWNNESNPWWAKGDAYPEVGLLQLSAMLAPGERGKELNSSFAFVIDSACVASSTASNDPWYATESVNELPSEIAPKYQDFGAGYRIKTGRPALSCKQTTRYCFGDNGCYSLAQLCSRNDFPSGLCLILGDNFFFPKILTVAQQSSVFGLQSYVGSVGGAKIDAARASLKDDVQRLVLAAYFSTKEAFHNVAFTELEPGMENILLDADGNLLPGSASFVLRTRDVVTLRYDLLIVAPTFLIFVGLWLGVSKYIRRKYYRSRFDRRQQALNATQLVRILDERVDAANVWDGEWHMVPMPVWQAANGVGPVVVGDDGDGRPGVEYEVLVDEKVESRVRAVRARLLEESMRYGGGDGGGNGGDARRGEDVGVEMGDLNGGRRRPVMQLRRKPLRSSSSSQTQLLGGSD